MLSLLDLIKCNFKNKIEEFIIPSEYDNYNLIIDHLYLGNYLAAKDQRFINNKKINLVINCSKDIEYPSFYKNINHNFEYIRLPLNDSTHRIDQFIMQSNLYKLCRLIDNYYTKKLNVFVHCYAGMQRSATVVICYLIFKDHKNKILKSLDYYYHYLKWKRIVVFKPKPTFVNVIKNFYNNLHSLLIY